MALVKMSWAEEWCLLYSFVNQAGKLRDTRNGLTRELIGFNRAFLHPHFQIVKGRGGSEDFALIEQLSYIAGVDSEILATNFPGFRRYQGPGKEWYGAYGPRLKLHAVIRELSKHPDSRRGVALIYEPDDTYNAAQEFVDIPCTIALNFWRSDEFLNCHVFMRSTDIWKGIYYDVPAFYAIQQVIAWVLGVEPGPLWFTTTSLHLYKKHWDREIVYAQAAPELQLPTRLFEGLETSPDFPILQFGAVRARAYEILQTFYKVDAPPVGGHATI